MCYVSYRGSVEEEVRMRIRRREQFTAYTITCALRERGFREPHMILKEVVHCLFRYGKMSKCYTRTFVRLENGCDAFVFHHRSDVVVGNDCENHVRVAGLTFSTQRGQLVNCFAIARIRISLQREER